MAKVRDRVWFTDAAGQKQDASITRAQTLVDGLPASDSYDADTVDLVTYSVTTDEAGDEHRMIAGGFVGAKQAKTPTDKTMPGHWWPRS